MSYSKVYKAESDLTSKKKDIGYTDSFIRVPDTDMLDLHITSSVGVKRIVQDQ